VNRCVIERVHRLKLLTVEVKAGRAVRKYRVVKSDAPNDLVFQSVHRGLPIRDNNILTRFIKPAGRAMGFALGKLALPTNLTRGMAEAGRGRRERCAGPDATLAGEYDT
jgi:hypothetical protein